MYPFGDSTPSGYLSQPIEDKIIVSFLLTGVSVSVTITATTMETEMLAPNKRLVGKYCQECLEDIEDCAKDGETWSEDGGRVSGNASCRDCGLVYYVEVPVFVIDRMHRAEVVVEQIEFLMETYFKVE